MFVMCIRKEDNMRYKNYTNDAIYELENQRIGNYDDTNSFSCENGCYNNTLYRVNGQILCEDCLIEEVRNSFTSVFSAEDDENSFSNEIIKDIISDFSDSEILTYIENRYDKF